ncbi:unnamed protein product, partial [Durusdinium trenchii]
FRWSATCAVRAPSRQLGVVSRDLAKQPSIAMRLWAIGAVHGLQQRKCGAARRRAKAASLRIRHPSVMQVLARYGSHWAIDSDRLTWHMVLFPCRSLMIATQAFLDGSTAGLDQRRPGAAATSSLGALATCIMVPVLVGTLTLLSPITMSLVELLAVLPVVLQQAATAGPVVAAILLAATITFIMSSITWCIDPGIIDFVAPYLRNLKHFCTNLSHHLDCKMNARQELKTKTLEHEVCNQGSVVVKQVSSGFMFTTDGTYRLQTCLRICTAIRFGSVWEPEGGMKQG